MSCHNQFRRPHRLWALTWIGPKQDSSKPRVVGEGQSFKHHKLNFLPALTASFNYLKPASHANPAFSGASLVQVQNVDLRPASIRTTSLATGYSKHYRHELSMMAFPFPTSSIQLLSPSPKWSLAL